MEEVVKVIHDTMSKSLLVDLCQYLQGQSEKTRFCIYSDYCLEDEGKPNKVASFTIAPAWTALPYSKKAILNAIPKDIKKSKSISTKGVELLVSNKFFHINFIIKDMSGIIYRKDRNSKDVIIEGINETINMIQGWINNQPEGEGKFNEQISRFTQWQNELKKKSPNIKLARNILLIPTLAAYIAFLITKYARATDIIWFSDRDKIVHSYNSIAYDIFDICHYGFCDKFNAIEPYSKIGLATSQTTPNELWFDHLIRIPDYLAGTLSSWDMPKNLVQKTKHAEILQKVFAENNFCAIINLDIGKNNFNCSRQTISLIKPP